MCAFCVRLSRKSVFSKGEDSKGISLQFGPLYADAAVDDFAVKFKTGIMYMAIKLERACVVLCDVYFY